MGLFDFFKGKKEKTEQEINAVSNEKETVEKILKEIYEETATECVKIQLTDTEPSIFESKVGGLAYIPHDANFPVDSNGNQLRLLAQIECEKIEHPYYPKQGLLQFWFMNDEHYGADFDDGLTQNRFRIVYHRDIDETVTETEILSKLVMNEYEKNEDGGDSPLYGEYGMTFTKEQTYISDNDERFGEIFCKKYNSIYRKKKLKSYHDCNVDLDEIEGYEKANEDAFGHKIGGYPGFTQYDPRDTDDSHDFLLFQLDSDFDGGDDYKVMWGDAGIANFFINSEKLKKCDFTDVLYNWDCS